MSITQGAIDFWPIVQGWTYNDIEGWWEWVEEEEQVIKEEVDEFGHVIEDDVYKIENELEVPTYQDRDQQDFTDFW